MWRDARNAYDSLFDHLSSLDGAHISDCLSEISANTKYSKKSVEAWNQTINRVDELIEDALNEPA